MSPAVVEALAKAEQALADLRAAIGTDTAPAALGDDDWPLLPDDPDLVSTSIAAERAGRSLDTVRRWALERGVGRTYGGRYRISLRRLKNMMANL